MLKSLIVKFGQNDISSKGAIVKADKVEAIIKRYKYDQLLYIKDNLVIIRYSENHPIAILELIGEHEREIENLEGFYRKKELLLLLL